MDEQILQFYLDAFQRITRVCSPPYTDEDITQEFEGALDRMQSARPGTKTYDTLLAIFRKTVSMPETASEKDAARLMQKTARATSRHREELQVDTVALRERYTKIIAKVVQPAEPAAPAAPAKPKLDFSGVF